MSLLPQEFLKSIVHIKTGNNQGTGFLYGIKLEKTDSDGENYYAFFLVTNKHMTSTDMPTTIKLNKINGGIDEHTVDNCDWIFSESENIDIALLQINANYLIEQNIEYLVITDDDSINSEDDFLAGLQAGQEIFLAGFPLGLTGIHKNFPIVRQGIIARNDEELISEGKFYLDVNNFPGNSGGPIFLKPTTESLEGRVAITQSRLIGTICAYIPFNRTLFDNSQNPPVPMSVTNENSGIAIGVPIYIIYNLAKAHIDSQPDN